MGSRIGSALPARWLVLGIGLATVATWVARADVVPEPPPASSCPPGSEPTTDHSGAHCEPGPECERDSECSPGTCETLQQCIEERDCGGCGCFCSTEWVLGPCEPDGTCPRGTCRTRDVCVDP